MKRVIAILIVLAVSVALVAQPTFVPMNLAGKTVEPGSLLSYRPTAWSTFGGTGTAFEAATTTPDATHRTAAAFDDDTANHIQKIDSRWNRVLLRCCSTTDGDSSVFDVFLMVGDNDHYTRIGTLTFTTGTQTSNVTGSEFADTLAITNTDGSIRTWRTISPTGNYIAMAEVDVGPGCWLGLSPTTITSQAVVEIVGF